MGMTSQQVSQYQQMAQNPEAVQTAIQKAIENGDVVSRSQVMKRRSPCVIQKAATRRECAGGLGDQIVSPESSTVRIEAAKFAAGITEECRTWTGWKALGYEVVHGSKALFQAVLLHSSKGDGEIYKASFFGRSQVQEIETESAAA